MARLQQHGAPPDFTARSRLKLAGGRTGNGGANVRPTVMDEEDASVRGLSSCMEASGVAYKVKVNILFEVSSF